jgi:XTP/dITP diphosphohydrolase
MIGRGDELLVATRNRGKTKEFREAFGKIGIAVKDLHDVEGIPDIEETGETFADNAYLKAKAVADLVGLPVLADDSGLCVDALNGAPGVYSARYAGEAANDAANNAKLLLELKRLGGHSGFPGGEEAERVKASGLEPMNELGLAPVNGRLRESDLSEQTPELLSSARFVCSLVLYDPADDSKLQAEGSVEGSILSEARGTDGFGYDPLFWLASHGRSMAELSLDEKNAISHRGQALRRLLDLIEK